MNSKKEMLTQKIIEIEDDIGEVESKLKECYMYITIYKQTINQLNKEKEETLKELDSIK